MKFSFAEVSRILGCHGKKTKIQLPIFLRDVTRNACKYLRKTKKSITLRKERKAQCFVEEDECSPFFPKDI